MPTTSDGSGPSSWVSGEEVRAKAAWAMSGMGDAAADYMAVLTLAVKVVQLRYASLVMFPIGSTAFLRC